MEQPHCDMSEEAGLGSSKKAVRATKDRVESLLTNRGLGKLMESAKSAQTLGEAMIALIDRRSSLEQKLGYTAVDLNKELVKDDPEWLSLQHEIETVHEAIEGLRRALPRKLRVPGTQERKLQDGRTVTIKTHSDSDYDSN